jgi:hypothetical protein
MSVASVNNLNVLAWYTAEKYQNHRKEYAYGKVFPFVVELGYLPPFQIPSEAINEVTKVRHYQVQRPYRKRRCLSQLPAVGFSIQKFCMTTIWRFIPGYGCFYRELGAGQILRQVPRR